MRRVLLLLLPLLALLPAPPPAAAAPPAAETDLSPRRVEVAALNREVGEITRQMAANDQRAAELTRYGTTLAGQVNTLKKAPSGVVRDAQLKDALKKLRGVLADLRNLQRVQRILNTTLRTRQVALARKAEGEAGRLMERGEADVEAGRDTDAFRRFEAAMDLLILGNAALSRGAPAPPELVPEPSGNFALHGEETPDEMRELALLLRDGADKIKWNGTIRTDELARLQAERATLARLLALESPRSEAAARALGALDGRIAAVSGEIERLQGDLKSFLFRAAILDEQANREDAALLAEAARPPAAGSKGKP